MTIKFQLTGEKRKGLVNAISEIIGAPAEYQFMPTCAYKIGDFYTVTKEVNLDIIDSASTKDIDILISELASRGYEIPSANKLTVQMPADFFTEHTLNNLQQICKNKSVLFQAAFKTDLLDIIQSDDKVEFPWFTIENDDDAATYCTFISMLCEFAKNQKRINNKPETTDNPKYTMRCYLLRLGMIGSEYKAVRKVLLRNLSGSSAFRKVANDEVSE